MFLYFKQSTIVWLLLQFLEYSDQNSHGHLFSSFPKEIAGESLTVTYKYNGLSDFIYAKCPDSKYKHAKITDRFNVDKNLYKRNFLIPSDNEVFVWIPMTYNYSGPISIYCGILRLEKINSTDLSVYDWFFNLSWEKKPDPIQIALPDKVSSDLPSMTDKCGADEKRTLIYFKDKENGLKKFDSNDKVIDHVNDIYYYFQIPDNDEKMEMKEPCAIVKSVFKKPEIIVKGHNASSISLNNLKIYVIKQKIVSGTYSIKLYLKNEIEVPDFYEGEKVKMQKMKFTRTGIEELPNSEDFTTSSFSIKGFQLVKFSYDCPTPKGSKMVERIFYFGPESEKYIFPNDYTVYLQNETTIQPNCSVNRINFGYLESVTVGSTTTNLNELKDGGGMKNDLKLVQDYVFMTNVKEENVTLNCFYITPNGNVTLVETFIKGIKVFVGYNSDGKEIHEVKMRDDKSKEYEKKLAEKDKIIAEKEKSSFGRFKDKVGAPAAYVIVILPFLLLLVGILIASIICYKKFVKPWIKRKKFQDKNCNIFTFWKKVSEKDITGYFANVQNANYFPASVIEQKRIKKIEGGEEVGCDVTSFYNKNLVKCYKDINGQINAYYVDNVSPERTYIISNGPTPEKVGYFWELLYREDIGVVVAIINQKEDESLTDADRDCYWSKSKKNYGKITVEYIEDKITMDKYTSVIKFKLTMAKGKSKELTLLHVFNWKEYEIPLCDSFLASLYENVVEHAGKEKVLIQSSHLPGSRVYMLTYFTCTLEALKGDIVVENISDIFNQIREKRYGGSIASTEFAYIIKALVSYFFKYNLLTDIAEYQSKFYEEYDRFMYNTNAYAYEMDDSLKNFLPFANILDHGKTCNIIEQFLNVEIPSKDTLLKKCTRFYAVDNNKALKKIRYSDIPCYDAGSINIKGKSLNDLDGFIHANEMIYKYGEGKERKIIMCQAPLKETMEDMLDMVHRYDIGIIVILNNMAEMNEGKKCFSYLVTSAGEHSFGNYKLIYKGYTENSKDYYIEYNYSVVDPTKQVRNFKVLHFLMWPNNGVPTESKSIHDLYKRIIKLYNNRHIAIQCSNGVGRTGALALMIYMIDLINSKKPFDPIKCLLKIRQHRCKALHDKSQYGFALSILYEHYKEKIDAMNKYTYNKCIAMKTYFYSD
uniref:6-cysteine protein n=1 Tax=Strongyloides stercoralis TaxID=6248 RepID=A0A0K0EN10_STRER